jgi:mannose-1-phosphate guanylyltransferase
VSLPAVILVGGESTRLRPLTERIPKPMLPLHDRPLLAYTFDHLRRAGVSRIVLACGYLPTAIEAHFGDDAEGVPLCYRIEPEPLGTGGGIRFAANGIAETFLALNGDSLREADVAELVGFHRRQRARVTILLTRVEDPSRFGVVRLAEGGRVEGFVEKPRPDEIDTDLINAGLYVLEPDVLELVPPGQAISIERDVFPVLAARGELFGLHLPGAWLDVGTPASFLEASRLLLGGLGGVEQADGALVARSATLVPPVGLGAGSVVEADATVGPFVHVGAGARVGARAFVSSAVLLPGAAIAPDVRVGHAIVDAEHGLVAA